MTYPPQQPYGGQDPYGQGQQQPGQYGGGQTPAGGQQYGGQQYGGQQYGGQPYGGQADTGGQQYGQQPYPGQQQQYGGYQQPTGQYGAYDPNAQYGGLPGGQYGGGYGAPPPKKKNTGVIVAVIVAVVVLAGVGITGFVAPGFFLSDDKNEADGGGNGGDGGSGADPFIQQLVAAADGQDGDALKGMACKDAETSVTEAIDDIDRISGAKLKGTEKVSDTEVKATIDITVDNDTAPFDTRVVKDGSKWCWKSITFVDGTGSSEEPTSDSSDGEAPPTGGDDGDGGSGDNSADAGRAFVQEFLDDINGGDTAAATSKMCPPNNESTTDVTNAITAKAQLQMDEAGTQAESEYVGADLKGTLNGAPVSAARTSAFYEADGWCILTFYAF